MPPAGIATGRARDRGSANLGWGGYSGKGGFDWYKADGSGNVVWNIKKAKLERLEGC